MQYLAHVSLYRFFMSYFPRYLSDLREANSRYVIHYKATQKNCDPEVRRCLYVFRFAESESGWEKTEPLGYQPNLKKTSQFRLLNTIILSFELFNKINVFSCMLSFSAKKYKYFETRTKMIGNLEPNYSILKMAFLKILLKFRRLLLGSSSTKLI